MMLKGKKLKVYFHVQEDNAADTSASVGRNKILGIIGEVMCGKSDISHTILCLLETVSNNICFVGKIPRDLPTICKFADNIAILYKGILIERAPTEELLDNPLHPYTRTLLASVTPETLDGKSEYIQAAGKLSFSTSLPDECCFIKHCKYICALCHSSGPGLIEVSPGHFVACHIASNYFQKE